MSDAVLMQLKNLRIINKAGQLRPSVISLFAGVQDCNKYERLSQIQISRQLKVLENTSVQDSPRRKGIVDPVTTLHERVELCEPLPHKQASNSATVTVAVLSNGKLSSASLCQSAN